MVLPDPAASLAGLEARLVQRSPFPFEVELACPPGEILALVGPSGSGKTTILRTLAGLHTPADGYIRCADETWLDTRQGTCLTPQARRVGMVFQSYALFPHLTAEENILEAMPNRRDRSARARARALLAKLHLGGLEQRLPHTLSGGQQQRVALARALAREPRALLLDEPFSAVDRTTRESLHAELASLRRELAMPVVLVTHDLDDAVMLSDRMLLISEGRALQAGSPLTLLRHPAGVEAARLLGLRNVFDGEVLAHEPAAGRSILGWQSRRLSIPLCVEHAVGARVQWYVPVDEVRPFSPDRASEEEPLDNSVEGLLLGEQRLSDRRRFEISVSGASVYFEMSHAEAANADLAVGQGLNVHLHGRAVHLMPSTPVSGNGQWSG